jgi:hypothetical protein
MSRDTTTRRALEAIRRDARGGGAPVSYVTADGQELGFPGDELYPFVKDPPAIEGPYRYRDDAVAGNLPLVAAVANYNVGFDIDTAGFRVLTLWLRYLPGGATGVLSLVPQARLDDEEEGNLYFDTGVVDPTLDITGPPAPIPLGGAFRNARSTEIRYPGLGGAAAHTLTLSFDVNNYETYRFLMGDVVLATSQLDAWYLLER